MNINEIYHMHKQWDGENYKIGKLSNRVRDPSLFLFPSFTSHYEANESLEMRWRYTSSKACYICDLIRYSSGPRNCSAYVMPLPGVRQRTLGAQ